MRQRLAATVLPALVALVVITETLPAAAQAPAVSVERIPAAEAPADRSGLNWQLSSKFPIDPADPSRSVPTQEQKNSSPMEFGYYLQDLASEGSYADKRQDHAQAAKYWAAVAKAVPDVAVGYRKACRAYLAAKDREKAIQYCGGALTRGGVIVEDYVIHGDLMLAKPTPLDAVEVASIDAIVAHLRASKEGQPSAQVSGEGLACGLGVQLGDIKRLELCTRALMKSRKADPNTLFFRWNLAMLREDYSEAKALLKELKNTAIAPIALRKAEEATAKASVWWKRPLQDWRYGAALAALTLLVVGTTWFRRRRTGQPSSPAQTGSDPATAVTS